MISPTKDDEIKYFDLRVKGKTGGYLKVEDLNWLGDFYKKYREWHNSPEVVAELRKLIDPYVNPFGGE
tara:strand:+ start:561 stop:764 length:204 start_codon:yes stop_codon:yes gene_type:complete